MKSKTPLDVCIGVAQDVLGFNETTGFAEREVAEMRYLLAFVVMNEQNFIIDGDPDGTKKRWIERARLILPEESLSNWTKK